MGARLSLEDSVPPLQASTKETRELLERDDVATGLAVVQTVYAVGMVLGLEKVLEASYGVLFLPAAKGGTAVPRGVVIASFAAVMLLAVRFFWVPRNVYSYVIRPHDEGADDFYRKVMLHITIALAHAFLFFFVCHAFTELAEPLQATTGATGAQLAVRFVAIYSGLLLLNGLWLLWLTPKNDPAPGRIWSISNLSAVAVSIVALGIFWIWKVSDGALVGVGCAIFLLNSAFDLVMCAQYYILFEPIRTA
jgi:hypothetical protein